MLEQAIETLKARLQRAAFTVAQPGKAEEAHRLILDCILELEQLADSQSSCGSITQKEGNSRSSYGQSNEERREIAKVESRLRLWARRPTQINTQILVAYLKASKEKGGEVTEDDIRERLPDLASFETNFVQMKIIAPKNHGKVFEQIGDTVHIWPPVRQYVDEFARKVLK